jgi:hypothetical protein
MRFQWRRPGDFEMRIPTNASEITTDWLTEVLAAAPNGPFGPVSHVDPTRIGEGVGVMSEIFRLAIDYAPGGRPGPATLVAKIAAGTAEARGLANNYGFYEREVAFTVISRRPFRWGRRRASGRPLTRTPSGLSCFLKTFRR